MWSMIIKNLMEQPVTIKFQCAMRELVGSSCPFFIYSSEFSKYLRWPQYLLFGEYDQCQGLSVFPNDSVFWSRPISNTLQLFFYFKFSFSIEMCQHVNISKMYVFFLFFPIQNIKRHQSITECSCLIHHTSSLPNSP